MSALTPSSVATTRGVTTARRPQLRDGRRGAGECRGIREVGPCVRARHSEPEVRQEAPRLDHITTRDLHGLDTKEAGGRDRVERQDVQAQARTPNRAGSRNV